MPPEPELTIVDALDAKRYEARLGGQLAGWVDYRAIRDRIVATHTEVPAEFEGRGIGSRLIRHVIADARTRGLGITPVCPFFKAHFERHPEDADVVRTARDGRTTSSE
jgi:predicted GNAT family acetyltransferase